MTQLQNAGGSPADDSTTNAESGRILQMPPVGVSQAAVDTFAADVDTLISNITDVVVASIRP